MKMKRYTFLIILVIVFLTILKLVQLSKPVVVSNNSDSVAGDWGQKRSNNIDSRKTASEKLFYVEEDTITNIPETGSEGSVRKLRQYVRAYVNVQNYMARAGRDANYKDTREIVNSHGLSVGDYTRISTQINKDPLFREKVQKLINEIEGSQ
ncbi:MAG: DUF4168 domain-containing protein [Planctomycetes bacterium]|nr:DUF4168 domain-containing protein [Planctomycetota bacterium]